jgi:hypothetical protein
LHPSSLRGSSSERLKHEEREEDEEDEEDK